MADPDFMEWWEQTGKYDASGSAHNQYPKPAPKPTPAPQAGNSAAGAVINTGGYTPDPQPAPTPAPTPTPAPAAKKRPGSPVQGVMGSPNLGSVSALQSWSAAIDKMYGAGTAAKFLNARGINPTVNGMNLSEVGRASDIPGFSGMSPHAQQDFTRQNTDGSGNVMLQNAGGIFMDSTGSAFTGTSGGQTYVNGRPTGVAAGGGGGFAPSGGGSGAGGDDLDRLMKSTIGGMLSNPTGYNPQQEQMLRNRAASPIAAAQKRGMEDVRLDAARRGAAASDADIRDQLGRVRSAGAAGQARAGFDVDMALADLGRTTKLGALGAGSSYLGHQRALAELQAKLAQQQEETMTGGLGFGG